MSSDGNQADVDAGRRRVLSAVGAAGIAGLAGCGGRQSVNTGEQTPEPTATEQSTDGEVNQEGKPLDSALTVAQWAVPSESQYNVYNSKNDAEARRVMFDRLLYYNLSSQEYEGYAVSDWEFSGDAIDLTVRDGYTWHDGDEVTARDLEIQLKLDMYTGGSLADYVSDISEAVSTSGDKTVRMEFESEVNRDVVLAFIQPKRFRTKESVYGEYLDAIEAASSEDARSEAIADLQAFSDTEPIGNGPFQWEDADSQRTLVTKYEDHPDADSINFPEMEYRYLESNQKRWSALQNGQTDGSATLFMPENQLNQLPDSVRVGLIPRHWGMGLVFDLEHDDFGQRAVRQAVAHVINRKDVAANSAAGTESKLGVEVPSGLTGAFSGNVKDVWLDGVADDFDDYSFGESGTDAAATLLEDAGYEKQDGTWTNTETGEPLEAPIKGPAGFTDWVAGAETIVAQLKEFGIESELIAKESSTYWGQDYANGNFVIGLQGWANYDQSYPYFHFDWMYRSSDATEYWNVPETFEEVPSRDGNGASTVTPSEQISALSRADEAEAAELIQELAWVTNQTLPTVPVMEKLAQTFLTSDEWNVPPRNSEKLQTYWPTEWLPRRGDWTAKRE